MQHHEATPPLAIARGAGGWLYDVQGRRYFDAISSWWVNLFGHANPRINEALKQQLDTLEHAMLAGLTHAPVVELSEKLSAMTEHKLGHCFYASDGASAVEIALKMSFHSWRNQGSPAKRRFVCLERGYHGETIGALGVTDVPIFRDTYERLLQPALRAMSPDGRQAREGETELDVGRRAIGDLETLFQAHGEEICAVIVEPLVQCAGGMAMHGPGYLRAVRMLCDRYNVHMIADEIAVGCGRTGRFFACEHAAIWPDFMCLSKGISGGYLPLSLVMTRESIYQNFYNENVAYGFLHSHSYTGNPLACRAALASLEIFAQDNILAANLTRATQITKALEEITAHEDVRHFRQHGMIWAFDVRVPDPALAATFSRRFFAAGLRHELLVRPIGTTVYLMPPYIINDEEITLVAERLHSVLREVVLA